MLKFLCTHCGGRLAIQEKYLSRLVQCPDCGQITHPMASQILADLESRGARKKSRIRCENCGHRLGKLAKPRVWGTSVVCGPCYRELAIETAELDQAAASAEAQLHRPSIIVGVARSPSGILSSPLMLEIPAGRHLPAPMEQTISSRPGALAAGLPAQFGTALTGLVVAIASLIVTAYVLRSIGSIILWMALAAVIGLAGYFIWRAATALKPVSDDPLLSGNRSRLPIAVASGIGRLCYGAGASLWRGSRRRSAGASQIQQHA